MASMPAVKSDEYRAHLCTFQASVRDGVGEKYAKSKEMHWSIWNSHCDEFGIDPFLKTYNDPVPHLAIFAQRYRSGEIAPKGKPVTADYVSDILCSIGQAFSSMGTADPRFSPIDGKIDFRLRRQKRCWKKGDAPPRRVKPCPVTIVLWLLDRAYKSTTPIVADMTMADMICIAFFFLLRPGEYTGTTTDDAAFTLNDVYLYSGRRKLSLADASDVELRAATSCALHFTTQKNLRKGDVIAQSCSLDPYCCPVRALVRIVLRHRAHFAYKNIPFDGNVPLASYYFNNKRLRIKAVTITEHVREAARACFLTTGINADDLTARSLRAGGAMALLCGRCDTDQIKLLGRWHSDAMMRYLHQEAQPVLQQLARKMFNSGRYSFLTTDSVPARY